MGLSVLPMGVVTALVVAVMGSTPTLAQAPTTPGSHGDVCKGYEGLEGVCELVGCATLEHEVQSLTIPEYLARHGPPCGYDGSGGKLVCCPNKITDIASKSCGQSTLRDHQEGGVADPAAWPWLASVYNKSGSKACNGVLISNRHVLIASHCVAPNTEHTVVVGQYKTYNFTGVQNLTSSVTFTLDRWRYKYPDVWLLVIMVLDTPANLVPNKVWPVCVTSEPKSHLGYTLDGLRPGESRPGILPKWERLHVFQDAYELQQKRAFLLNCSEDCDKLLFFGFYCPPHYNASLGDLNPGCIGGLNNNEDCLGIVNDYKASTPFVVQSFITRKFYVAGMKYGCRRYDSDTKGAMIPVTPVAKDILAIIGD